MSTDTDKKIHYVIDSSKLTFGDFIKLQEAEKTGNVAAMLQVFDKILILEDGISLFDLPFNHLDMIVEAVLEGVHNKRHTKA